MKSIKTLFIILAGIFFHSCTVEEPTSGENSFFARVNGEKYIPKTSFHFPAPASHGLQVSKEDSTWHIIVNNQTDKRIHVFLNDIEQPGTYLIENVELESPTLIPRKIPTSVIIDESRKLYPPKEEVGPEYIKITEVQDSLIIGEFQKITLTDPENPSKTILLTDGRFNINLATLDYLN